MTLYSLFNFDTRWGWVVNVTLRPLYSREIDAVSLVQQAELAQGPVWPGAENLLPTEFDPRTLLPIASR